MTFVLLESVMIMYFGNVLSYVCKITYTYILKKTEGLVLTNPDNYKSFKTKHEDSQIKHYHIYSFERRPGLGAAF